MLWIIPTTNISLVDENGRQRRASANAVLGADVNCTNSYFSGTELQGSSQTELTDIFVKYNVCFNSLNSPTTTTTTTVSHDSHFPQQQQHQSQQLQQQQQQQHQQVYKSQLDTINRETYLFNEGDHFNSMSQVSNPSLFEIQGVNKTDATALTPQVRNQFLQASSCWDKDYYIISTTTNST